MSILFEGMNGKMKKLYSALWAGNDFIEKNKDLINNTTDSNNKVTSLNSYCFAAKENIDELLIKIFGIAEPELFRIKFNMAVSGAGQEIRKISTLHSSSLCALLHFYNVTDKNPLILSNLETDKKKRAVRFTKSFFEFKSPVINNPSNMDVVLTGKDTESDEDIVFFLESKFSEYYLYAAKETGKISNKYLSHEYSEPLIYNFVRSLDGLQIVYVDEKYFKLVSETEPFYIDGIKQMISHYTGIRNVLAHSYYKEADPDNTAKQKEIEDVINNGNKGKGAIAILGEIVFDRFIGDFELRTGLKCGAIYSKKYEELAKHIGHLTYDLSQFEIMKQELGYSLFITNDHFTEEPIRQFYREKK